MKKFNIFSILRPGKLFLLTLAAWLTMSTSWAQDYLGFTATEAGTTTVMLNKNGSPNSVSLQYRVNEASTWTNYSVGNPITLSQGEKVEFRATSTNSTFSKSFNYTQATATLFGWGNNDDTFSGNFYYFSFSKEVEGSGNVLSLLDKNLSLSNKTIPAFAFVGLFKDCSNLLSAPELPDSTYTLSSYCYAGMFYQCTSLRTPPTLSAKTLTDYCYTYMFAGCEKLQSLTVKFKEWHDTATDYWVRTTRNGGTLVTGTKIRHQFSATGGTFYKDAELPYQSDETKSESRIPNGWIIPANNDYLLFSWNSAIANKGWLESLLELGLGNIYATIQLAQSTPTNSEDGSSLKLEISTNGKDWSNWNWTAKSIQLDYGSSCFIRAAKSATELNSEGKEPAFSTLEKYRYFKITLSSAAESKLKNLERGCICVTGNVMSLLDKNVQANSVPEYGFYKLFSGAKWIFNAPTLPATDLSSHCYDSMFEGCTRLNSAPNLPATSEQIEESEAEGCYNNMFSNCTKLEYIHVGFKDWNLKKYVYNTNSEGENVIVGESSFSFTNNWVSGVDTKDGTFKCPEGLTLTFDDSHIPTKWETTGSVGATEEKEDWLCLEITSSNGTVRLNKIGNISTLEDKLQYSTKEGIEGSWEDYTWSGTFGKPIELDAKEGVHRVYFRSKVTDDSGRCSTSSSAYYNFSLSGTFVARGNIMSLLHKTCEKYAVGDYEFYALFKNCKKLISSPSLPATNLGISCYEQMFNFCESLVQSPELPAEQLKESCYYNMFAGCKNLLSAPELPALNLKSYCYFRMFTGCSSLISAPALNAKDLVDNCYNQMFQNCSSLNYIKASFLEWHATATNNWVNGVSNNGIFVCSSELNDKTIFGPNRIPKNDTYPWTILEEDNTCLYFETKRNGSTIQLKKVGNPDAIDLLYSTNDGSTWSNYEVGTVISLFNGNQKRIYFKNKNVQSNFFSKDYNNYYQFIITGSVDAHGDLMSLLSYNMSQTNVPNCAFFNLFNNCKALHSAPKISATELSADCYRNMFVDCSNLTSAPELPAMVMKNNCYANMFVRCSKLAQAPELPATTLANQCYSRMFEDNTSLVKAPSLPATQLADKCYEFMFRGCSNIQYANVGFSSWDNTTATNGWFSDYNGNTIQDNGIFICPEELPHTFNSGNFGPNRIPKLDTDDKRWKVNVVALSFTASNKSTIMLHKQGNPANATLECSTDNAATWQTFKYDSVYVLKEGKSIFLRANDQNERFSIDANNYYQFITTGSLSVKGSIMSLLRQDGIVSTISDYTFYNLFGGCEGLRNAPELPSTTLAKYCYAKMFSNCDALEECPKLPATSLAEYCYASMFENCSAIKEGPVLCTETLCDGCYNGMFSGCTNLRIAPYLPATTLASGCYTNMFNGCSSLCEISVEFSAWNPSDATTGWVSGVANQGIFSCPTNLNIGTFAANRVPKDNNHKWEVNPDFLGFKAITDATIALNKVGNPHNAHLIYSVNSKSKWKSYSWDGQNGLTIELHAGESVYFKAENDYNVAETTDENNPVPNKLSKDADNYYQFAITGTVAASGKASFLLSRTKNSEEVPTYGFYRLFKDCTGLTTAPGVAICDKANAHSYESMFEGCSNMTTSPETLPATTLAESCYKNMFKGCEKMATSPDALPATSVVESCYESMFEGDSLITRIPTLGVSTTSAKAAYKNMFKECKSMTSDNMPSTLFNNNSVSESFYEGMFDGCSTIEKAEFDLLAGGLAKACYKNMFRGCSSLTKVPKEFGTPWNIIESCYEGMFEGCSSLETAPTLSWTTNAATTSFKNMFKGCSALRNNIPSAMSSNLATSCYESMFEGCESLTTAPTLSTTNLAEGCYKAMFKGCTSLVSSALPTLPARVMKTSCYESMFEDCTGLTTPATQYEVPDPWNAYTLAEACFKNMYKGCTSLTSTPNTFNNALYASCFEGMFEGCTSLTKVPSLAQDILAERCYYRMFAGCTSLKQAPELPAKKENLKDSCYAYMFNGCTNLHYMDVAFNEWHYEDLGATHKWVENVSPTGTFMCPDGLAKVYDINHIPKGWSAEDNGDYLCFTALSNEWTDLQFTKEGSPNQLSYKYSTDKKNWTSVAGGTYQQLMGGVSVGTTVYIKITEGRLSKDANNYWKFTCNKPVAVSGNITSLLDASMEQTDVPDYSFYKLFAGCTSIQDISGLKMPATEVGAYAYANMFEGCTYLQNNSTVAPELPATTLGNYCYQNLFKGWKKLQVAPALPAKTLAEGCYSNMFNGCTDLKSVSALPATELQAKCYESMFAGCAKLDSLNVAFTAWSPSSATNNWVAGVSDEGNFVCPWALAQDAISKSGNNLEDAYGESMIPKDHDHPWLILLVTDMEFDYKTGTMTIAGRKPITYTTDPSLTVDNRIGTTVNETSTTVDLKDWLNDASITDLDSITYYAIAGENMNGGKIKPTVNKMTIYRYPKKIDMCICDNETRLKKALYYANKVSSPRYPIKLFIPDGTYNLDETLVVSDSTISLIGESLNGTILKSSAPNGVFKITGDNVYMQDMKLVNTASGAAFTNRSLNTTMRVAIDGYYIEAPGGVESKRYALPEATWNRATDPTQATIASVSQNGSTLCVTPGENNTSKYLVRVDNKYSFASTKDFFILESLEGKNVYVRAANARGAFGEPVSPDKLEANGSEYTELTIKLNGNGFSSFSFDDPLVDQLKVIGASVYKGVYHEGAVYLTRLNEHDIVPRGTGVILAGLPNATLQLYYDNATVDHDPYKDVTGDNIPLYGNCNEAIQRKPGDGKYYYGLSGNVFKKLSETGSVKPNKAFFDLTGKVDANATSIRIIFGMWEEEEEEVVSGINYLPTAGSDSEYSYMLTGVRMKDAKGLVIQNNKVVLIK